MPIGREQLRQSRLLRTLYRFGLRLANRPAELGMTTPEEQAFFIHYAREEYTAEGEIVDLGCWLGSTTISLAKGWSESPRRGRGGPKRIHAFDHFIWHASMEAAVAGTVLAGKYKAGDRFESEFLARTKKWSALFELHAGDLRKTGWNGVPIEFLLIDAMKSWELAGGVVRGFYPSLMPGKSLVVHQDFGHYYTSWIHLLHYRFRESFDLHADLPNSASTIFRLREAVPTVLLELPCTLESFSDSEIDAAFDLSLSFVSEAKRPSVAAAKVMTYLHRGDMERAADQFTRFVDAGIPPTGEMAIVEKLIEDAE